MVVINDVFSDECLIFYLFYKGVKCFKIVGENSVSPALVRINVTTRAPATARPSHKSKVTKRATSQGHILPRFSILPKISRFWLFALHRSTII